MRKHVIIVTEDMNGHTEDMNGHTSSCAKAVVESGGRGHKKRSAGGTAAPGSNACAQRKFTSMITDSHL
eukprot:3900926-Pyramimonas_sp.AAC.1